jgi:hypothetical protein
MKSHLIKGESIQDQIKMAKLFSDQHPEFSILLNNTEKEDDIVLVSFDGDEQIDYGNLLFINLFNPGKVYSSNDLQDGIERFVKNYEVSEGNLDILFYKNSSSLVIYLSYG